MEANRGKLTNVLAAEILALATSSVWEAICEVVKTAFADGPRSDLTHKYPTRRSP